MAKGSRPDTSLLCSDGRRPAYPSQGGWCLWCLIEWCNISFFPFFLFLHTNLGAHKSAHTSLGEHTRAHMSTHTSLGAQTTAHTSAHASFGAHTSTHTSAHIRFGDHTSTCISAHMSSGAQMSACMCEFFFTRDPSSKLYYTMVAKWC